MATTNRKTLSSLSIYSVTYFDRLPNHRGLIDYIDQHVVIRYEDLSNSARLQKIMNKIIAFLFSYFENKTRRRHHQHTSSVAFWGLHAMTVRLNLLKAMLIYQLCIPQLYQMIGMGTIESTNLSGSSTSSIFNWFSSSSSSPSTTSPPATTFPTEGKTAIYEDLIERAKAIIIETFSLFLIAEEGIINEEYKYCPIFPQMITIKEDGKYLLELFTCYTLSTTAICDALKQSIKNVISSIIDVISDSDSRYPIEAPFTNQKQTSTSHSLILQYYRYIFPIIYDYLQWCHAHAEILMKDSRKDEIVMSVNANLRASLKNELYNGPNDILIFYHQKYRDKLTNIEIPLQPYTVQDVEQAKKDIKRETVILNKTLYRPATCSASPVPTSGKIEAELKTAWLAMREEMKKVLIFLFAIDNPEILEFSSVDLHCKLEESTSSPRALNQLDERLDAEDSCDDRTTEGTSGNESNRANSSDLRRVDGKENDVEQLDKTYGEDEEYDTFNDVSIQSLKSVQHYNWDLIDAINLHHYPAQGNNAAVSPLPNTATTTAISPGPPTADLIRRASSNNSASSSSSTQSVTSADDANTILSKQLLKRNSRLTRSRSHSRARDSPAAIVYGDLLELLHCHIVLAASRTIAAGDAFIILNDLYGGDGLIFCPCNAKPTNKAVARKEEPFGDISIAITTSVVKIVLRERYRLLASQSLDHCGCMEEVSPLMCFECTTTTLMLLSPEAYLASGTQVKQSHDMKKTIVLEVNNYERAACLLNVLITDPDKVCKRAVTIEPYLPTK